MNANASPNLKSGRGWLSKAIWTALSAAIATGVSFGVRELVDTAGDAVPKLYYTVNPTVEHTLDKWVSLDELDSLKVGQENCVSGSIELGNDGGAPLDGWVATIQFPQEAKVRAWGVDPQRGVVEGPSTQPGASMTLKYAGSDDVLYPGDKITVQYLLDGPETMKAAKVYFKGDKFPAIPKKPESAGEKVRLYWLLFGGFPLCFLGGFLAAIVFPRALRAWRSGNQAPATAG